MMTAVAVVVATSTGQPIGGVIAYLQSPTLSGGFLFAITNNDGYAVWNAVPSPFTGTLQLAGAARPYGPNGNGEAVTINAVNVTLRVGPTPSNPQDILLPAAVPFKNASVLPAPPTRAQICGLKTSLAGLTYQTTQYGPIPAWFYARLNTVDRAAARATHKAAGDTHLPIPITEAYLEPGTLWPDELLNGYDYTQDLAGFRAVLIEAIADGLLIDCPLGGDGLGAGPGYNDPVGHTYGQQWLMDNLARIIAGLQGDGTAANPDLTPYIIFRPGWDGVFYGWGVPGEVPDLQPTRVRLLGELFRSLLPNGYLSIEHTPGNIPCGEGGADYAPGGLMQNFDTILSEFSTVHEDSCWQVVGRMVQPYNRPPDQPSGDDPHPPFYLAPGNPRGPYFYVAFEPKIGGVYQWARGQCTLADVQNVRAYLHALGCTYTG